MEKLIRLAKFLLEVFNFAQNIGLHIYIFRIKVCIYSMCMFCEKHEESIQHLFKVMLFEDKIDVSRTISVIKGLTCLVGNSSKVSMKNHMLDFNVIKFFNINTRNGKVFCHLPVRWECLLPG